MNNGGPTYKYSIDVGAELTCHVRGNQDSLTGN